MDVLRAETTVEPRSEQLGTLAITEDGLLCALHGHAFFARLHLEYLPRSSSNALDVCCHWALAFKTSVEVASSY